MKITKIILISCAIVSAVFCSLQAETDRQAQTFDNGKSSDAVSYGLGSNGGFTLKDDSDYKTPQMVVRLLPRSSPYEGAPVVNSQVADEIPSITNYYEGGDKLNSITVQCRIYANMNDCTHANGCGWCGSLSRCVTGNQAGPLEACSKSTYVFTTGGLHRNERVIKENVGGLALTIISK